MVEIVPINYPGAGDFIGMIKNPDYHDTLFIFCDNIADHNTARSNWHSDLRRFNQYGKNASYPRSAGIPVSRSDYVREFQDLLEPGVLWAIDSAIDEIQQLITRFNYRRIMFLAFEDWIRFPESKQRLYFLASECGDQVVTYITQELYSLGTHKPN